MFTVSLVQFLKSGVVASLCAAGILAACSSQNGSTRSPSTVAAEDPALALVPRPSDPTTELAQLQRFRGQTAFLNPNYYGNCHHCEPQPEAPKRDEGPGERNQQESDVFKVGEPGSKTLYLLNNYRGLQVVSFKQGVENAQLLGHSFGSGFRPHEMYYDSARKRIIALETEYRYDSEDQDYMRSHISIFDVSDSAKPSLVDTVAIGGYAADTRIVGDVLYVAARKGKSGFVRSYTLTKTRLRAVETRNLSAPVSMNDNNMSIQAVAENGKTSYYLVATLSESSWGWWDRANGVEVVDISDPKGRIRPLMSVAAKGVVRERSWTKIKDGVLIVTSNYTARPGGGEGPARIAVETFKLPGRNPEILSEQEAQYRRMHIQRALQGKTGREYDEALEKLVADPVLGIRGRFVTSGEGLRKLINDTAVTVGDGSGLHANLRDVRYEDGLLYAFWVPQNNIDPFDLFDISNPQTGTPYLSRLHFEGWIERAIPMDYQGRKFVVGLGWVIPVVNDDSGRRQPQAMIFEIMTEGGRMKAVEVAQYSFVGSNIWADFNDQDKMIEIRKGTDGRGEILFGVSKYEGGKFESGGQMLAFDLVAAAEGRRAEALKPGVFLSGGADWIRRVFTNTEIDRINTFSDRALATFSERPRDGSGTLKPAQILELARSLQGYVTIQDGDRSGAHWGVQIISGDVWNESSAKTTLRLVNPRHADAEKSAVVGELAIDGSIIEHKIDAKSGDLLVLSARYENVKRGPNGYDYQSVIKLTRVGVQNRTISKRAEIEWGQERNGVRHPIAREVQRRFEMYLPNGLLQLGDGTLIAQIDSVIYRIDLTNGLKQERVDLTSCQTVNRDGVGIKLISGRMVMTSSETVESRTYEGLEFARGFVAEMKLNGAKAECGQNVNVPGSPLLFTPSGELLTSDLNVVDIVRRDTGNDDSNGGDDQEQPHEEPMPDSSYDVKTRSSLIGLKVNSGLATLKDEAETGTFSESGAQRLTDSTFVHIATTQYNGPRLEFLSLDGDAMIEREAYAMSSEIASPSLMRIDRTPSTAEGYFGLLGGDQKAQVIRFALSNKRPVVVPVAKLNERGEEPARTALTVRLPQSWSSTTNFNTSLLSYEIVHGLSGISQLMLKP